MTGHLVRIVDPAEEDFPYTAARVLNGRPAGQSEIFGRAERVRDAYRARFRAHGERRERAGRAGWAGTSSSHRTDHAP